ncbi:cellulose-binding domain-containing protein [Streptomyces litchfieldiae]|uniref:Cellulose-binding domain-containing protein n=1 Tax=Streptomyces litchfieldiae TaxID=3075543 RepID=A0ABU2MXE4_9ACTN|nr:cellulose-binding domain-containing protein [Streptomyces sp. DSM 44938]MDT0346180.1 cellulose-binding domain-containing protein [Streptomyces sp. DSM 44938]
MSRRGKALLSALAAAIIAFGSGLITATTAQAAAEGCRVDYQVSNQWQGGFGAAVTVTNLGAPVTSWSLEWSYSAGQTVSQAWNAEVSQSGARVTARNAGHNGALATGASASFGFNGTWNNSSNPVPATFAVNGVTCTGQTTPTDPPPTSGWNPPSHLVTPLNEVWAHQEATYNNGNLYAFRNYGWDQLFANGNGTLNFCVRWDSSASVTATQRDQIHAALNRAYDKWFQGMAGHNAFPYSDVDIEVVGWAVRDRSQLQWSDNSVDIYVNDIRENAPQCAEPCGRFFHQDGRYPDCPGGISRHYDQSLWLTDGFGGGAGGDWGQRMGREYFMNNLNTENMTILLHEIGHTFGLDDFYDWTPTGVTNFIMKAGSSSTITEFDTWMLRDWWRHLKSRYGY